MLNNYIFSFTEVLHVYFSIEEQVSQYEFWTRISRNWTKTLFANRQQQDMHLFYSDVWPPTQLVGNPDLYNLIINVDGAVPNRTYVLLSNITFLAAFAESRNLEVNVVYVLHLNLLHC